MSKTPINWTPEMDDRLGKVSDGTVAQELGISRAAVVQRRQKLGIPAIPATTFWTPEMDALLGSMSDSVLAQRFNTTRQNVASRRWALGIAPPSKHPERVDSRILVCEALSSLLQNRSLVEEIAKTIEANNDTPPSLDIIHDELTCIAANIEGRIKRLRNGDY